eukprot:6131576-Pleurochrysis_carterae.AAC.1
MIPDPTATATLPACLISSQNAHDPFRHEQPQVLFPPQHGNHFASQLHSPPRSSDSHLRSGEVEDPSAPRREERQKRWRAAGGPDGAADADAGAAEDDDAD